MKESTFARSLLALLAVLYCGVILLVDYLLPLGAAVASLYALLVFATTFIMTSRRDIYWTAAMSSVFLMIGFFVSNVPLDFWERVINRGLVLFVIWSAAEIGGRFLEARTQEKDSEARFHREMERKNAQLAKANEELSQFAYRTSHDLKAPLATIQGLARFIETDMNSGRHSEVIQNSAKIIKQSVKLSALVTDILDLTRADLEQVGSEVVDFSTIIDDVKEKYAELIAANGVTVSSTIHGTSSVRHQRTRLIQVLENLISNAIKYSNPKQAKRYVHISIEQNASQISIKVQDNGIGIPKQHQSDTFKMFKRFHPKLSFGSGLGMSIVKKHIESMGGRIQLLSSEKGTTVEVTLPVMT